MPSVRSFLFAFLIAGLVSCASDMPQRSAAPALSPATAPSSRPAPAPPPIPYPETRRTDVVDRLHGMEVHDPYRWLEDGASPEVKTWMQTEDAFARAELSKIPVRAELARRLKDLAHQEQQWAPEPRGRRLFYQRRSVDRERAVVYWRDTEGPEHVLLDPDTWSPGAGLSLGNWVPSWDGNKIVYQVTRKNADAATLRVIDVVTGKVSDTDVIEGGEWPVIGWTPKSDGFYYHWVPSDPTVRANRYELAEGRFHKLGDDPGRDTTVRAHAPGQTGCPLILDSEGRWLLALVKRGWARSDVYVEDLHAPHPEWRPIAEGHDANFDAEVYRGTIYLSSTEGAPHGEIFAVDPRRPERSAWRRIIPERPDATMAGFEVLGHRLVVQYLRDAITRVEIRELDGSLVRESPARIGTTKWMEGTPDGDEAYYEFNSYDHPPEVFGTSIQSGVESSWYRQRVPAIFSELTVEQVFYPSKDGTRVPMIVFHRKDLKRDGSAPLLFWGYGASNVTPQPNFSPLVVPWVERGGVYAAANLRGGGEYGEEWHRAGSGRNKQNTFDDYIAGAEYLIRERYTTAKRLAARGASWGGLLVTAALTQRPDLFRAVLAIVPQTDMVRFPLSGLGKTQLAEFGDPDDPADFRALFSYSPYHRVTAGTRYPAVLVSGAEADERVDPMHARKFAAALQAASTGGEVLLRVEWDAGHKGTGLAGTEAENRADEYAFALDAMGLGGR